MTLTGYPLHSPVFPSLPLPCVTVCYHISTGPYHSVNVAVYSDSHMKQMYILCGQNTGFLMVTKKVVHIITSQLIYNVYELQYA